MKSHNFEILRRKKSVLADLGRFAETYVYSDPSSALVKLRSLAETLTVSVYQELRLEVPHETDFMNRLSAPAFCKAVPGSIRNKLHAIRRAGNKAAHGETATSERALKILRNAFDVSQWYALRCLHMRPTDIPAYQAPARIQVNSAKHEAQKKELQDKLDAALKELDAIKATYEPCEVTAQSQAEGQRIANALHYDEKTTRKLLVDQDLESAGWDVTKSADVTTEVKVGHQPGSGVGYIDYVLWDDNGKPLALVEAKKTTVSEENGKKQAVLYADGLEKEYGQRPIIFYTNGYNIWMWDDAQGYPPRQLCGFYSKSSLQKLVTFQRPHKQELQSLAPDPEIAGRLYQVEAIKRVCETFTRKHRKALIVQATGTGKTRVAVSLVDLLIRANWVTRVLFLCDRKVLLKQAKNAFSDYTDEPVTDVSRESVRNPKNRIFVGIYKSVDNAFRAFDVGFFDLIITDESHRTIYKKYSDLFRYFDGLQIGLTATPVECIARNTYDMFGCATQDPTACYSYEEAVQDGYLVPYRVYMHTTKFQREGIKYRDLPKEERDQIEEDGEDLDNLDFEPKDIDRKIYNKDTNRQVLRNLMENGLRDASGQTLGKSIIFARNHRHAVLLRQLFDEMYPQYGGRFCQVIDSHDSRAEQLVDDFKGYGTNDDLTLAISVDMLDTGIDIPEIVNLAFAKPVKSKVKFLQMIGRGTRLCPGLFGSGRDKSEFLIFDHWPNFERFDQEQPEANHPPPRALMQRVFEARLRLASAARSASDSETFAHTTALIAQDVGALPSDSFAVRDKWKPLHTVQKEGAIERFSPDVQNILKVEIAPLMQWINIHKDQRALAFDLLMTQLQVTHLQKSPDRDKLKDKLLDLLGQLNQNINTVKAKQHLLEELQTPAFWDTVTCDRLEAVRTELRQIMHGTNMEDRTFIARVTDIAEDPDGIQFTEWTSRPTIADQAGYHRRIRDALKPLYTTNPTLRKIRAAQPVSEADLEALTSLILTENPGVDLRLLKQFDPEGTKSVDALLRSIIGMDSTVVEKRFEAFVTTYTPLNGDQNRFLKVLKDMIARHGPIEVERLLEPPFTERYEGGVLDVFPEKKEQEDLLHIVRNFTMMPDQQGVAP